MSFNWFRHDQSENHYITEIDLFSQILVNSSMIQKTVIYTVPPTRAVISNDAPSKEFPSIAASGFPLSLI